MKWLATKILAAMRRAGRRAYLHPPEDLAAALG